VRGETREEIRNKSDSAFDRLKAGNIGCYYTVSGKKRPQYSRRNFDKFRHSFSQFLTRIILILQCTKTLENLAQPRYVEMTSVTSVIKNAVYRQRRTFNKSFSKGKT